jgi:hypothetical protein
MTKEQALNIIKLLSALESWAFSTKNMLPDYLHDDLCVNTKVLEAIVLEKKMTEQDKEFAKQAWVENDWDGYLNVPKLIALIRADEREACAKVCESWLGRYPAIEIMNAIRARGNT